MALSCYSCDAVIQNDQEIRCSCGEPLWVNIDSSNFSWPTDGPWSMWRYDSILPVEVQPGIATAAGGTPLVRASALDIDRCRVYVKVETVNPTGSFKDRGSATGVLAAIENSVDRVGTVSHGNMAISMAAIAAGHGIRCLVLVPTDISDERLRLISRFGADIIQVEGPYSSLYYETHDIDDIMFVNSDAPYRVAGQKTVAYEICEQFGPTVPDAIVLPVSSGGQFSGIWKALRELKIAGYINRMPALYAVQSEARAPIVSAFEHGRETVTPVAADETIAYSIGNIDPPSGNRVLAGIRESDGGAVAVSNSDLRQAQRDLATKCGIAVETSSAVALAGARKLYKQNIIKPDSDVVIIATGTGLKENDSGFDDVDPPRTNIDELAKTIEAIK